MHCHTNPYEGQEPYIFLSFCQEDAPSLLPILRQMTMDGYRIWYDEGSRAEETWQDTVQNHLEDCHVVIVFVSQHSTLSHRCNSEIIHALKCGKKVLPIALDEAPLPKGLGMLLKQLQCLRRSYFASDRALVRAVCHAEECKACLAGPAPGVQQAQIPPDPIEHTGEHTVFPPPEFQSKQQLDAIGTTQAPNPDQNTAGQMESVPVEPVEDLSEATVIEKPDLDEVTVKTNHGCLALLFHPLRGRCYTLRKAQTKLGRSPIKCDVVIEGNKTISKHHADIIQYEGKCFLLDVGSANGTYAAGTGLEAGKQVLLSNPAVFQLNDETLVLVSGLLARKLSGKKNVPILLNEAHTAARVMDGEILFLNRNNKWPDGTLSDVKIHRAAHAVLKQEADGIYLIDESPEDGNSTYCNGSRMHQGDTRRLTSGDHIRLGDTVLEYLSITI